LATASRRQLAVRLNHHDPNQNLGRFRLSFTNDATTLQATRVWLALTDSELAALHIAFGKTYAQQGRTNEAISSFTEAIPLATERGGKARILAEAGSLDGVLEPLVPHLAKASAADPKDTTFSLDVAALQAWFGQEKEYAATRQRILAIARDINEAGPASEAARACSLLPSTDQAELEAALALGRTAATVGKGGMWNLLALGMAEYRSGDDAAAEKDLLAAVKAAPNDPHVTGIAAFYRAMTLFRQGKPDEARQLATAAVAKMKPLPGDANNPLTGNGTHDDLILWLASKEAKALIGFDAAPPPKAESDKK
jgi:tetratricopeptide (TPR) repeat protein